MIMGSSTETMPPPYNYNSLILMEEKYNTFSVSSNFNGDQGMDKTSLKTANLNNDNLGEYLIMASGLRRPFNLNYEGYPQNNYGQDCQLLEDFLIYAANLHASLDEDIVNTEPANDINIENSLGEFLIKAAGFNEPIAKDDDFSPENNGLQQFLINASHIDQVVPDSINESIEPDANNAEINFELFLMKAANLHDDFLSQE
jgi:hypothetical protein